MKGLATLTQDQASSSVLVLKEVPRDISGDQGEIPIPGQMGWPKSPESQEHQVANSTLIFHTWEFFRISLFLWHTWNFGGIHSFKQYHFINLVPSSRKTHSSEDQSSPCSDWKDRYKHGTLFFLMVHLSSYFLKCGLFLEVYWICHSSAAVLCFVCSFVCFCLQDVGS